MSKALTRAMSFGEAKLRSSGICLSLSLSVVIWWHFRIGNQHPGCQREGQIGGSCDILGTIKLGHFVENMDHHDSLTP